MTSRWLVLAFLGALTLAPAVGADADVTGRWLATGVPFAPWIFDLKQAGTTLTGHIEQHGPLGGSKILEGRVSGDSIFFKANSPDSARTIAFTGTIDGDVITFTRTVDVHPGSGPGGTGLFGANARPMFTAQRDRTVAAKPGQHWVVDSGVAFRPWTFDLLMEGGTVTGSANQARIDPPSGGIAPTGGPFAVFDGKVVGDTITFKLKTANGGRIISFKGTRRGDQIDFTRTVQVAAADSGRDGILGAIGATHFVATLNGKESPSFTVVQLPNGGGGRPAPSGPTQTRTYSGMTIDITAIASAPDRDSVIATLHRQIDIVDEAKMPEEVRQFMKTVPIVMTAPGGISTGSPATYSSTTKRVAMQPQLYERDKPVLLHELLHAYHDQKIPDGYANADIVRLFEQARANGRFPAGSYMLSNVVEYFAMMGSVYLHGSAARDPFVRDSIKVKQPECYRWLEQEFGPRDGELEHEPPAMSISEPWLELQPGLGLSLKAQSWRLKARALR